MSTGITMASMSRYAILGCGSVGHAVAEELAAEVKDVLILDMDDGRVEALRDQDLDARTADIREQSVVEEVDDRDVVLILSSDVEANKEAVRNIRQENGDEQHGHRPEERLRGQFGPLIGQGSQGNHHESDDDPAHDHPVRGPTHRQPPCRTGRNPR